MLRRKLSAGALRAAANSLGAAPCTVSGSLVAGAHAAAKPTQQQSANLASAVLLNSQRKWKEESVVTLKLELKRRGLSQVGNKSSLVSRLESADTSALLPPIPAMPATHATTSGKRTISTSRPAAAPPKSSSPTKPSGAKQAPIVSDTVNSTGPAVESQKMEAPKTEAHAPEIVTAAPGLPETAKVTRSSSDSMTMKIPESVSEPEMEQVIPLEPDNFRSNRSLPANEPKALDPAMPKVITAVAEETLPGGGPSHAIHDDHVPSAADQAASKAADAAESFADAASDLASKLPSLGAAVSSALGAPGRAMADMGVSGMLPSFGAPKGEAKQEKYKASSEPLNNQERTGAYVLGGIVALGLFLGGGKKGKGKGKDHEHGSGAAAAGSSGVKGDQNWEKASGAGIVGHGSRKA